MTERTVPVPRTKTEVTDLLWDVVLERIRDGVEFSDADAKVIGILFEFVFSR